MALLILLVGAAGLGPVARMAEAREGSVATTVPAEESARPIYLNGWNHTTLHALRRDKTVTYLQAAMEPDSALSLVDEVERAFAPNRLLQHLECVNFGGRVGFASLALLWPSDDDDLRSMLAWHEARMPVFDPHTYILEDGGMKQTNWAQLEFKREADPHLLLNCGKMRAAFEEEAVVAGDAGPMAAAYRLGTKPPPPPQAVPTKTSRYWSDWTTKDFATADLSDAVAVLPIGAIEAHGPHLPLGTDALLNVGLLSRAVDLLPDDAKVLVLPPQEIGVSCEHTAFAGTLQISSETAIRAWFEIAQCVARAGVRKIVIYNSHGGNQALAEVLARKIRLELNMLCVLAMNLGCGMDKVQHLFPAEEFRYGIHGGAIETSLMIEIRPDLVHMEAAEDFASSAAARPPDSPLQIHQPGFLPKVGWLSHDLNPAGVVGAAATQSDKAKGTALAKAAAGAFADLLVEVYRADVNELLKTESRFPPQGGGGGSKTS